MTDINDFRTVLQQLDPDQCPLDIAQIMIKGARVRRRHRLAVGATSGLAVVALLIGGSQVVRLTSPTPTATAPSVQFGAQGLPEVPDDGRLGEVVPTGLTLPSGGEWVLSMKRIDSPDLPDTSFGITIGIRQADGTIVDGTTANETEGSDRSAGFHAVIGAMNVDGQDIPPFGYYVGAAAKITATVKGKTVRAGQAAWSEDPSVVLFWFPPKSHLSNLAAFDRENRLLPPGKTKIGVG
jgi:hypothetical protein